MNRREFLKSFAAAGAVASMPGAAVAAKPKNDKLIWSSLLHLGLNMWSDHKVDIWQTYKGSDRHIVEAADHIRFDEGVWNRLTTRMSEVGMNMVVIDLGEGLQYPSHPELAVKGSWSPEKMRKELTRLRKMGLEPIPKLNFSATHDIWLKEYSRMLSTSTYYKVCADVIKDVCEIFDHPRFFHLGYDEETPGHQAGWNYIVVRQGDLWWHDFLYITGQAEKHGSRPLVFADRYWHHQKEFLRRMPKSVLLSNWEYEEYSDPEKCLYVKAYLDLEKAGFDQLPCGSNWDFDESFGRMVELCKKEIAPERLKGFMMASWMKTVPQFEYRNKLSIDLVGKEIEKWNKGKS